MAKDAISQDLWIRLKEAYRVVWQHKPMPDSSTLSKGEIERRLYWYAVGKRDALLQAYANAQGLELEAVWEALREGEEG